jgi:hypothetical protein
MNRNFLLSLLALLGLALGACQKEQTEAERKADIEREVQRRLAAERQTDEAQKLDNRQAELDAREKALAERENRPEPTVAPMAGATPAAPEAASAPATSNSENTSYATFYRKLDPYGDWMETSDYGYVFQPRQAAQARDWRPYTNGHWVYTDAGWTWISDEQFGWATYHYGRWIRLRSVGWVWVPGEQWAPAWVSWRKGNEYVGWAPLPPEAQFDRQTGIRNWADSYYDIGPEQYAFVPANEFGRKLSSREIVPAERNVTIINQTTNVTNITYNNSVIVDRGPSYDDLRARSRQPIERFRLERTKDSTNERPVFRGEVVALPTVDFHPAEREARPRRVTRNLAQPVVERGWSGIKDTEAAQKARAKMNAEATPPPNRPPKRFVRPGRGTVTPPRPAPVQVGTPAASATPASTPVVTATTRPTRPGPPPRLTPTAVPIASATASGTPVESATVTTRPPRPGPKPSPTESVATPQRAQPSPAENISLPKESDRYRRQKLREEKREERKQTQAQRREEREQKMLERKGQQREEPATTPSATAEASAAAATTSPNEKSTRQERTKRNGKKGRKGAAESEPATSPTPTAHQP